MANIDLTTQTNLCKGLRACGIPRRQSLEILNVVEKWTNQCGPEWTNSRIKDLRQWYETTLTGEPKPPKWFKHSKDGLPLGIWSWVFKLKPAKALGVLSLNTVFYASEFTQKQEEKFLHALAGNKSQNLDNPLLRTCDSVRSPIYEHMKEMPEIRFPTVFDMTGSIPVHNGRSTIRPSEDTATALKALRLSWESVPQVTFDFLDSQDKLGYMPIDVLGNKFQLELNRPHDRCVGRVSVLQQPQFKARVVGNPNRVLQVTLDPLKILYMGIAKKLPTDVTHDQESGVRWVQEKLKQGIELAGSDLTSASDLLDVRGCLDLVNSVYKLREIKGYEEYEEYFFQVSRAPWFCPVLDREVQWEQGDVLGTGPSFGLLTLTNNAAGFIAYEKAINEGAIPIHTSRYDAFRVVGDDIVMLSNIEPYYNQVIESLGGEINHSKTLKSNRVAEFAGRIITPKAEYLKAIKYCEPSDNSFMNIMTQLGDQAKFLLKPKQRKVYDFYKYIPGIAVEGPWVKDSYGIPFDDRYLWYKTEVEPAFTRVEPDLPAVDYESVLLKADLELAARCQDDIGLFDEPTVDEGYLPSQVTPTFKVGGDPRLTNGKTQLDVLHKHIVEKDITHFNSWQETQNPTNVSNVLGDEDPDSSEEEEEVKSPTVKKQRRLPSSFLDIEAAYDRSHNPQEDDEPEC